MKDRVRESLILLQSFPETTAKVSLPQLQKQSLLAKRSLYMLLK
jgi:hypothetical protein